MKTQTPKDLIKTHLSPFQRIKCTSDAGNEYWSNRDFAKVRQTIKELGGTMPENLPTADSIKKLEISQNH